MVFPLIIQDMNGKLMAITDCRKSSTVKEVRKRYAKFCGSTVDSISLVFQGNRLTDDVRLEKIPNLHKNSVLIACIKSVGTTDIKEPPKVAVAAIQRIQLSAAEVAEVERTNIRMENLRLEETRAARRHELEKMKLEKKFELKKLELQLKMADQKK